MDYKGKKVLIFGLGLNEGGLGSARFFAKNGAQVKVTDLKTEEELKPSLDKLKEFPEISYSLGKHENTDIDWADLVIKNQAVKPGNKFIEYAKSAGKEIKTDIGIFLDYVEPGRLVGITGTKGKSTTASLIYEVLKESGKKSLLCGNIGKSVLDCIGEIESYTLVVLEISSFQLESFDNKGISPKYALITNIYPDHLNYYSSMEEYASSKKLIAKYQTEEDFLFINGGDPVLNSPDFLSGVKSKIIKYSAQDLETGFKAALPGEHNLSNIAGALAVTATLGIDKTEAAGILSRFKGVKYRLELTDEIDGIRFYNNTTATAPEPAIESLKTFPNSILIAGGMNKGLNYEEFSKAINKYAKSVYFLSGDATEEIIKNLKEKNATVLKYGPFEDLKTLLNQVKEEAESGDVVLFSPGATSFNLFHNEFDRGRKFNEAVKEVFASEIING
jgi:UDP-N-acetylmuramoylalanine--D-glutamate ligase